MGKVMRKIRGPQFLRFYIPLIEVLRELGGSARPAEATDLVIERLGISEEEQGETLKNGSSRIRNQVAWARFYLSRAGYLDSSLRGIWSLTEKGLKVPVQEIDVTADFKQVHKMFPRTQKAPTREVDKSLEQEDVEEPNYRARLLAMLRALPSAGFERICQRLLRESGFEQVTVTGKSGDGGIDGIGILEVNPFVSFKVLFQCKRYEGSVSASQVRDFRGAMMGRADKGIIITTGSFTTEAKKEARRDGVPPLELVDGEKLVEMFERLELGLKPRTTYDIDESFFKDYQQ